MSLCNLYCIQAQMPKRR